MPRLTKHRLTKSLVFPLLATLVATLQVALAMGCGQATRSRTQSAQGTESNSSRGAALLANGRHGTITTSTIPPGQSLRGDSDADNPGDIDGNGDIDPEDRDSDYPVPNSYRFPDKDDRATFAFGHRPTARLAHTVEEVVKRYYSLAAGANGASACSMLPAGLASSVAEDYGDISDSSRRRGLGACPAALSALFRRAHEELSEAISVVEVRVVGGDAQVIFSSRKVPASEVRLAREGSSWKLAQLLGQPLP